MDFIRWLFGLCRHKWATIKVLGVYRNGNELIAHEYHLRCERCGDIKARVIQ